MELFDLHGRNALVTGGNGGIGLGIARGLAQAGAGVMIAGRDTGKLASAVGELQALGGKVFGAIADVTDEAQVKRMVAETTAQLGALDIFVANAGINIRKSPESDAALASLMPCLSSLPIKRRDEKESTREETLMTVTRQALGVALAATMLALPMDASAFSIFNASGANQAAIQGTVDAYRAALGEPNNGNAPGPLASGRREINWDGGGAVLDGTPPATPFVVFQNTRGGTFTTPGAGLTQAVATGGALSLDFINPQYTGLFAPFSPNRLFAPVGSNITDGAFSIPGTGGAEAAGVTGFGAIFSDVDLANTTTIEYFDTSGNSLGVFNVEAFQGNQTFSFLGITTDVGDPLIGSFRITTGNSALGPDESETVDLVVMDDFFYGEPQLVVARVSQPEPLLLLGLGLVALAALRLRRVAGAL